jgi:transcriptional regulator with XRE-family HTH domain
MQKKTPKSTANLPEILIAGRARLGLSQDSLAEKAQVSRSIITRIEGLKRQIPAERSIELRLNTLDNLARGLDVDVRDLLSVTAQISNDLSDQISAIRVAANLLRIRKELGVSQLQLSKDTGHFRTYIGRLELLRFVPVISDVEGIAERLAVDLIELFKPIPSGIYREYLRRWEELESIR